MNEPSDIILKFQGNAQFKLECSTTYAGGYQKKPFTLREVFFSFTIFRIWLMYAQFMLIYKIGFFRNSSPATVMIQLSEMFALCGGRDVVKVA